MNKKTSKTHTHLTRNIIVTLIFSLFSFFTISLPFFYRHINSLTTFFGLTFYENQLLYQTYMQSLSFTSLFDFFISYDFFQSLFMTFFQSWIQSEFLVVILFIITTILGIHCLEKNKLTDGNKIFTLLFCILSPSLIVSFISFDPILFVLPLLFLLYFAIQQKNQTTIFFIFTINTLLSLESAVISYLLIYHFEKKQKKPNFLFLSKSLLAIIFLLLHLLFYKPLFIFRLPFFESGLINGFTLYLLGVGSIGFFLAWNRKQKQQHLAGLLIVILSFFTVTLIPYATIVLAFYASITIEKLFKLDWQNSFFKVATLLLIYGLLISSYIFFIQGSIEANPSLEETEFYEGIAMNLLSQDDIQTRILTLERQKAYVSYYTGATAVVADDLAIYNVTNRDQALDYFRQNQIQYILVDKQMREGEIWLLRNSGLQLLLTDTTTFREVVMSEYATIYWIDYP